jgi:ferrous iron transport protein A
MKNEQSLDNLNLNQQARINTVQGGTGFLRRLHVMGIKEGQYIKVISKQPFKGPITIEVCGSHMTLGRGMAQKIMVEVKQ